MAQLVDRAKMESVFPPDKLVVLANSMLPDGLHESVRSFLADVGLPDKRSSWFVIDPGLIEGETADGPRRCAQLRYWSDYENMPEGAENWIVLGEIFFDVVAVDAASGTVYSLPDGEYCSYVLNHSLDSFGYFLYMLEVERPNYDFSVSDEIPDSEGVAAYLRELMVRADPVPFEGVEPAWSETFDWEAEDAPFMPTWERVLNEVYESIG